MIQVVWFKRDLRVTDHQPLLEACASGPVLALYVFETEMMVAPDYSAQHYGFIRESLLALEQQLDEIGLKLLIKHAPIMQVLNSLIGELRLGPRPQNLLLKRSYFDRSSKKLI